jgi:heterodisulfide reductase subunit C
MQRLSRFIRFSLITLIMGMSVAAVVSAKQVSAQLPPSHGVCTTCGTCTSLCPECDRRNNSCFSIP